jgi:hypothetical protein
MKTIVLVRCLGSEACRVLSIPQVLVYGDDSSPSPDLVTILLERSRDVADDNGPPRYVYLSRSQNFLRGRAVMLQLD